MRTFAVCAASAGFAVAMAAPIPKEWLDTYSKISKTIVDNNIKGYMTWMDKGFVNIQRGKKTTYAPYEKMFTDFMKPFTHIHAKATPLTFAKKGGDVIIDFRYTFSGDYSAKGQKKTLKFFEEGTDTWRKSGGRYLQVVENIKKDGLLPADANV